MLVNKLPGTEPKKPAVMQIKGTGMLVNKVIIFQIGTFRTDFFFVVLFSCCLCLSAFFFPSLSLALLIEYLTGDNGDTVAALGDSSGKGTGEVVVKVLVETVDIKDGFNDI